MKLLKTILSITLPIALGVFLIFYNINQFNDAQWKELLSNFSNANYFYVLLSVLFGIFSLVFRALRWHFPLRHLGYTPDFYTQFGAINVGYLMNMTIPRSGEVTRALLLSRRKNIPFDKVLGTIVGERVVDLIFLLGFVTAVVVLQYTTLIDFLQQKIPIQTLVFILIGITAFLSILFYLLFFSSFAWAKRLKQKIRGFLDGVYALWQMPGKTPFLLYSLGIWFAYVGMFVVGFHAIGYENQVSTAAILTSFVIGGLTITFTNSGFGSYPVLVAEILLLYQIPLAAGTAFGWIIWTAQTLMVIVLGAFSWVALSGIRRQNQV